jgi:2-oxoisovalerate dehydrogenase E2 component (dihydrolipoyl transacylase)
LPAFRNIPAGELRGATISLSNFGTFGAGQYAAHVIMPPQVAILGAGRISPRIVAIDGAPTVRRIMPMSVTFDHRVVTGAEAARFLVAMIGNLGRAD